MQQARTGRWPAGAKRLMVSINITGSSARSPSTFTDAGACHTEVARCRQGDHRQAWKLKNDQVLEVPVTRLA